MRKSLRHERMLKARAKAIAYLVDNPRASPYQVSRAAGVSFVTARKLIFNRQTPVEVLDHKPAPAGVTMLEDAITTFKQRGETYGDAAKHWADVAAMWTIISGYSITPEQAVSMMIGLKLLRLKETPHHRDSVVDIAGYAAVRANVNAANGGNGG